MNFQISKTVLCFKYNYCLQLTCLLTIVQEEILPTKYSDFTIFLTQKVKRGKTFPLSYVLWIALGIQKAVLTYWAKISTQILEISSFFPNFHTDICRPAELFGYGQTTPRFKEARYHYLWEIIQFEFTHAMCRLQHSPSTKRPGHLDWSGAEDAVT